MKEEATRFVEKYSGKKEEEFEAAGGVSEVSGRW